MSTVIGGTTVADPVDCTEYEVSAGFTQRRMADNTLITDYGGMAKKGWRIKWDLLTETQKDAIKAETDDVASQSFSPPDETGSYTVQVLRGTWEEIMLPMDNGTDITRYQCSVDLEEA